MARDFDTQAAAWDESPQRQALAQSVVAAIQGAIPLSPEMDVLDFGSGTGLVALGLLPKVRSVTGVDRSAGMLAQFQAKIEQQGLAQARTQQKDIEDGDALEGQYHVVVSSMSLHHIREIKPLLQQFHAVLHPGGYVGLADLDCEGGYFHPDPTGVYHDGFDREVLGGWLEAAGFSQAQSRTVTTLQRPGHDGQVRDFTVFLLTARKR